MELPPILRRRRPRCSGRAASTSRCAEALEAVRAKRLRTACRRPKTRRLHRCATPPWASRGRRVLPSACSRPARSTRTWPAGTSRTHLRRAERPRSRRPQRPTTPRQREIGTLSSAEAAERLPEIEEQPDVRLDGVRPLREISIDGDLHEEARGAAETLPEFQPILQ